MWNYINTSRLLILTHSKVKLTLMTPQSNRTLAALINASGESLRHSVFVHRYVCYNRHMEAA